MGCYCQERATNPKVAESMKDLPPGYCGTCDVCGQPGHTRAHPSAPVTGAWCDAHWQALTTKRGLPPDQLVLVAIIVIIVATIGIQIFRHWQ